MCQDSGPANFVKFLNNLSSKGPKSKDAPNSVAVGCCHKVAERRFDGVCVVLVKIGSYFGKSGFSQLLLLFFKKFLLLTTCLYSIHKLALNHN